MAQGSHLSQVPHDQRTQAYLLGAAGVVAGFAVLGFAAYGFKTAICKYILKKKNIC